MRVICKTNTSKLVKGATYEVARLWNKNSGSRARVSIKGFGSYVVKNFTQMDGTPLPQIDWEDPSIKNTHWNAGYIKDPETLKKGDIIACRWDTKYLTAGKKYRISEVNTVERTYGSSKHKETKIKVEGFNRWLNPWRFRTLSQEETRDLSLNEIFDSHESYNVDKSIRKIDTVSKELSRKVILNTLFNSITDPHRNNLSVIDWAAQKLGRKWDLNQDDFKPYLELTINQIIEQIS